jgi:hypothetical protein
LFSVHQSHGTVAIPVYFFLSSVFLDVSFFHDQFPFSMRPFFLSTLCFLEEGTIGLKKYSRLNFTSLLLDIYIYICLTKYV